MIQIVKKSRYHSGKHTSFIFGFLPAVFYLANLYRMTGHSVSFYLGTVYLAGIIGLLKLITDRKNQNACFFLFCAIYLVSGLLTCLITKNMDYKDLILNLLLFGITGVMFAYPMSYLQGAVYYYISLLAFIPAYRKGLSTGAVLTSSGNYISVMLILSAAIYYISLQNSDRPFKLYDLMPAFLNFILAVWARGRGGIVSCLGMLALLTIYYIRSLSKKKAQWIIIIVGIMFIALGYIVLNDISLVESFLNLGKWRNRGMDNRARFMIWGSYFEKMNESIVYFFCGAPLSKIQIINSFEGNTHNSFIQLHAQFGLIPLNFFFIFLLYAIIYDMKNKKELLAIVLITIVIRGMTDKFIFGQYGMPIVLYLVFYPFYQRAKEKRLYLINFIMHELLGKPKVIL